MSDKLSVIPDASVCEELCEQFAAITNTDTAFAQYFLQRRRWELNRAVSDYMDGVEITSSSSSSGDDEQRKPAVVKIYTSPSFTSSSVQSVTDKVDKIKFITWNIDGLDKRSLHDRTENVAVILNCELPDVVHLQELVPETYSVIETLLPQYKVILGAAPDANEYFTATLLRLATVTYESHEIIPFSSSVMGRNMLVVKIKVNGSVITFINSHLESTKPYEVERKKQLKTAFEKMLSLDANGTVFFAGDLNLRDKELEAVGGIPTGLEDIWTTCGTRPECSYTWDPLRNSNIEMAYPHRARFRFDRVYLRHGNHSRLVPKYFGLIGLEKIKACGRFPSDHWGIICHFEI